jgi:hypothetical protein
MIVKQSMTFLISGILLGAPAVVATPARAEDGQTERLQRQIDDLQKQFQKQLQVLQNQVNEAKQRARAAERSAQTAQQDAQTVQQAVQNIPAGIYDAVPPGGTKAKGTPSWLPGVKIKVGGFIAAETVWREHNEVSSASTDPSFVTIPYQNSVLYHENEFRFSAQQSRISLKATGDIDPAEHLTAYYENDWQGAGVTANSRRNDSYNLRIRQAWFEYDNDNWHTHVVAGQAYSLATAHRSGMLPLYENVVLTIDGANAVGFVGSRVPQIRFVQDWDKTLWFGVSAQSPQVTFPSNGVFPFSGASAAANTGGAVIPPGLVVNDLNACNASGALDVATACSNDIAPDIIEKVGLDPGWGHYEAFGLQRWFADNVAAVGTPNSWSTKVTFGWGVGGSVLLPVIPKWLDLQGSILYGQGIGRYGASQMPDVTVGPTGNLVPLTGTQILLGAVAHLWEGLDLYVYAGQEQLNGYSWKVGATNGGFGNPAFPQSGCALEVLTSGAASFNAAPATCTGNVQRVRELSIGFWQNLYKGDMGRIVFGAQYEYVWLTLFPGAAGPITPTSTPNQGLNPHNNIVFTSLRYYPFN